MYHWINLVNYINQFRLRTYISTSRSNGSASRVGKSETGSVTRINSTLATTVSISLHSIFQYHY